MVPRSAKCSQRAMAVGDKAVAPLSGRLALLLSACCLVFLPSDVSAEVGILKGGLTREIVVESLGRNWNYEGNACFMGRPNNLIVDPVIDTDFMKTQRLITDLTGPKVCAWLDSLYRMHMDQKPVWEAFHSSSKKKTSLLNVFKKVKDAFTSFPSFVIKVKVKYFDLYHDDRWGHSMPWFMATLHYKRPSDRHYGVFDHMPSSFSTDPLRGDPTLVHMLLSPAPTFNQHVKIDTKDKGSLLAAFAGGSGIGSSIAKLNQHSTVGRLVDAGQLVYSLAAGMFSLKFSIADFWLKGTECYLRTRMVVTSAVDGLSLCQFIASKGSGGLYALFKAEQKSSVLASVVGVDFFNSSRPAMTAVISEGLVFAGVNDLPVKLEIDNDPTVIPHYVRTVRMARKVRWTVAIMNFLVFVLDCVRVGLEVRDQMKNNK